MATPPSLPGTYALILRADRRRDLPIGKGGTFGTLPVEPGFYVYAGSAHGPGGLASRLARHRRNDVHKALRWHIDYLRAVTQLVEAWWSVGTDRGECLWTKAFERMRGAFVPMIGFGASDCSSGCPAHLLWLPGRPQVRTFRQHLADELGVPVEDVKTGIQQFG